LELAVVECVDDFGSVTCMIWKCKLSVMKLTNRNLEEVGKVKGWIWI
jgi:hypothetical protein